MRYSGPIKSEYKMKIPTLLLVIFAGCCANENLHDASFVFSRSSDTGRVVLKPTVVDPLDSITVYLQVYTDNIQKDSLFKLEIENNSMPLFHLYQINGYYYINIDGDEVCYKPGREIMEWRTICVSWDSSTGLIHFAVNNKLFPNRVLKRGFIIDPEFTAVLGENLVSVKRNYNGGPSFVGEIRFVHMWDSAFNPKQMSRTSLYNNGTVISWKSLDYEVHGDVFLYKPI